MPSWNIHIAQTERLLAEDGAVAELVRDRNAFLFGNVVPDIYVGYMVPGIAHPIPYRVTHFAKPEPIPKPGERAFWDAYVAPLAEEASLDADTPVPIVTIVDERQRLNRVHYPRKYEGNVPYRELTPEEEAAAGAVDVASIRRSVLDLVLGAWAHLLADNLWNTRVNEYLDAHGGKPGEEFRIKKQGDFDWFGREQQIVSVPVASERLLRAAAAFPQYPIEERVALETVGVIHEIVRTNGGGFQHPPYRLLTEEFFLETFAEVVTATDRAVAERL